MAHEANVDAQWDATIKPMRLARCLGTSREQLQEACGYGHGGCVRTRLAETYGIRMTSS